MSLFSTKKDFHLKTNVIRSAWRGEEKLWQVFWVYGILFGYILINCFRALMGMGSAFICVAAYVLYSVWILVSVWRCAFNVKWRLWGYIARIGAVILVPILIMSPVLATIFAGQSKYYQVCSQAMIDTAKKHGIDPQQYIAQNQTYLQQCLQYYVNINAAKKP